MSKIAEKMEQQRAAMAGIGHNRGNTDGVVSDIMSRLADEYGEREVAAAGLLDEARDLPKKVDSEETMGRFVAVVRRIRDAIDLGEAQRKAEKDPYWRGGQAVDGFFRAIETRLEKAKTVLEARVGEYNRAKLERQRAARAEELRKAQAAEGAARLKAERARKPETVAKAEVEATIAGMRADSAAMAAAANPADIARTRFGDGAMVTAKKVHVVEITDYDSVPLETLRPYLDRDAVLRAAKAWAKVTNFKEQLPGLSVRTEDGTIIR